MSVITTINDFIPINPINPITSINPTIPTWSHIIRLDEIIDGYFTSINKYQTTQTAQTTQTYQTAQAGQTDTAYHKNIDPFIIPCESDHIINDGSVRHSTQATYHFDRREYKQESRKKRSRPNSVKIQRQKGYLKQPGGASCDQRR